MKPEARKALDAICRRAMHSGLDDCPPVMIDASKVAEALFSIASGLGARETTGSLPFGDDAETLIAVNVGVACRTGGFPPLMVLTATARDELRAVVQMTLVTIQLLAEQGSDYGPVPTGIHGRDLGLAALAIEILQVRSPQQLLDLQRRSAH